MRCLILLLFLIAGTLQAQESPRQIIDTLAVSNDSIDRWSLVDDVFYVSGQDFFVSEWSYDTIHYDEKEQYYKETLDSLEQSIFRAWESRKTIPPWQAEKLQRAVNFFRFAVEQYSSAEYTYYLGFPEGKHDLYQMGFKEVDLSLAAYMKWEVDKWLNNE